MKLTTVQYQRALALAETFGHEWASRVRRNADGIAEKIAAAMTTEAIESAIRAQYEVEGDRNCYQGITSPSPNELGDCLEHASSKHRITWMILADGSVTVMINRPNRRGLITVEVDPAGSHRVLCRHPDELAERHVYCHRDPKGQNPGGARFVPPRKIKYVEHRIFCEREIGPPDLWRRKIYCDSYF